MCQPRQQTVSWQVLHSSSLLISSAFALWCAAAAEGKPFWQVSGAGQALVSGSRVTYLQVLGVSPRASISRHGRMGSGWWLSAQAAHRLFPEHTQSACSG